MSYWTESRVVDLTVKANMMTENSYILTKTFNYRLINISTLENKLN